MSLEQLTKPELVKTARTLTQENKELVARVKELEQEVANRISQVEDLNRPKEETRDFPLRAIAIYKEGRNSHIATVVFNLDSGEAKVEKTVNYGDEYKASYEGSKLLVSMEKQVYKTTKKAE